MPVALIQEWAEGGHNTANYDAITEHMGVRENPPEGLIVHTAGTTDAGGFRIFDVWETREHFERFMRDRLGPAIEAVASGDAGPPQTEMYELHSIMQR